jgi:hypothetical protein
MGGHEVGDNSRRPLISFKAVAYKSGMAASPVTEVSFGAEKAK